MAKPFFLLLAGLLGAAFVQAAEPEALTASAMAARLSAQQQDGNAFIRLRLQTKDAGGAAKTTLQIQIKSRATRGGTELVYQVLWPKERKGEGVLLRRSGDRAGTGQIFTPPDTLKPVQMRDALFGSNLSYEDVIDNFFSWDNQALVGTETIDRVPCQILESKPGKGEQSSYSSVKTWVDPKRMVPMRIEKYSGKQLARRIDTDRVATDDKGRHIPANLTVHGGRDPGLTDLDGSRITHSINLTDRDFTTEALREPPSSKAAE